MKHYFKNYPLGILQLLFSITLLFFFIPMFIHSYGLNAYGIFSVLSIFGNLTILFGFGLNTALLKFISGNTSIRSKNRQITASLLIMFCVTLMFTEVLLLLGNSIVEGIFEIENRLRQNVLLTYKIFLFANFFVTMAQPFVTLIQAHKAYSVITTSQWVYNMLNWGGIITLCQFQISFRYIALPSLLSAVVWFCLLLFIAVKKCSFRPAVFSSGLQLLNHMKKQLIYSRQIYLVSLLSFYNEPLLKMFVIKYLGAQVAGCFEIILKIKSELIALFTKAYEPQAITKATIQQP